MSMRTAATAMKEKSDDEFIPFVLEDYIHNPVALARIKAGLTRQQLAKRMALSHSYMGKIERQDKVTAKLLERVIKVLK